MPSRDSRYVSVTIPKELYKEIKAKIASLRMEKGATEEYGEKLESVSKFFGFLFEQFLDSYNLNRVLKRFGLQGGKLDFGWPSKAFTDLFGQMNWYKSTEWVRSENHAQEIGEYQWPQTLKDRIRAYEKFKFEKILVVSKDMWESPEIWRWVWKVFSIANENPNRQITISVTKEDKAKKVIDDDKYLDMGIYGDETGECFMGFLDHKHAHPQYRWRYHPDVELDKAKKAFANIGEVAEPLDSIITMMLSKHGFSGQPQETSARATRTAP